MATWHNAQCKSQSDVTSLNKTSHISAAAAVVHSCRSARQLLFRESVSSPPGIVHAQPKVEPFLLGEDVIGTTSVRESIPIACRHICPPLGWHNSHDGVRRAVSFTQVCAKTHLSGRQGSIAGRFHADQSTSLPLSGEETSLPSQQLTAPPPDCGAKTPDVLLRHDTYSGQGVAVIQSLIPNKYRVTRWTAPKLGC
jgi:hypothetical protein